MKNKNMWLLAAGFFLCAAAPAATQDRRPEESSLERVSSELNTDCNEPGGEKAVVDMLKSEFKVDGPRIQGIRARGLGYGEVSAVLTLAQNLPGRITDVNVRNVIKQRMGPPVKGWGEVTKELGMKPDAAINKLKKVQAEVRKLTKKEKARLAKEALEIERQEKKKEQEMLKKQRGRG